MSRITLLSSRLLSITDRRMLYHVAAPGALLLAAILIQTGCHSMARRPETEEDRRADALQCDVYNAVEGNTPECALDRQWDDCGLEVDFAFASNDEGSADVLWTTQPYLHWRGALRCGDEPHKFRLEPPWLSEPHSLKDLRFVQVELFLLSTATDSGCEVEVVVAGCEDPSCFRDYVPEGSGAAIEFGYMLDLVDYTYVVVASSNHLALWHADIPHQQVSVGIAEAIKARISFHCMKDAAIY